MLALWFSETISEKFIFLLQKPRIRKFMFQSYKEDLRYEFVQDNYETNGLMSDNT
jgi:hypothetical protein